MIGYVERGIKFASPETIEMLSKVLKVTPDELFRSDRKDAAPNAKREALHALGSLLTQESPEYIRMVARMAKALKKRGKHSDAPSVRGSVPLCPVLCRRNTDRPVSYLVPSCRDDRS